MRENTPEYLVVHHSATPDTDHAQVEAIRWYHTRERKWRDIGYHRIYEKIGGVYVAVAGRPLHMMGAHAPGYNMHSVGCCFVGNCEDHRMTWPQLLVGARDMAGLAEMFQIPHTNILRHDQTRQTLCPGKYFPWNKLLDAIQHYRNHPQVGEDNDFGLFA